MDSPVNPLRGDRDSHKLRKHRLRKMIFRWKAASDEDRYCCGRKSGAQMASKAMTATTPKMLTRRRRISADGNRNAVARLSEITARWTQMQLNR